MATLDRSDIDRLDPTVSAGSGSEVTTSDVTDLLRGSRALYVGGNGDVRVLLERDSAPITFVGVVAGSVLPIRARRVYTTGTTASYIVALY